MDLPKDIQPNRRLLDPRDLPVTWPGFVHRMLVEILSSMSFHSISLLQLTWLTYFIYMLPLACNRHESRPLDWHGSEVKRQWDIAQCTMDAVDAARGIAALGLTLDALSRRLDGSFNFLGFESLRKHWKHTIYFKHHFQSF